MIAGKVGTPVRRLIERLHVMNDTVKIERPMCCRRQENLGGRTQKDLLGNVIKVRTRVQDSQEDAAHSWLEPAADLEKSSTG